MKHVVDVRPVYHRLEDRIRAHVLLCWLALLLIRVVENEAGQTWAALKPVLAGVKVGIHRLPANEVWKSSTLTPAQREIFRKLKAKTPPDYLTVKAAGRQAV